MSEMRDYFEKAEKNILEYSEKILEVTKFPTQEDNPRVGEWFEVIEVKEYHDGMYGPQVMIKLRKVKNA